MPAIFAAVSYLHMFTLRVHRAMVKTGVRDVKLG